MAAFQGAAAVPSPSISVPETNPWGSDAVFVAAGDTMPVPPWMRTDRKCSVCEQILTKDMFSSNQWKRPSVSLCKVCVLERQQTRRSADGSVLPEHKPGGALYLPGAKSARNRRRKEAKGMKLSGVQAGPELAEEAREVALTTVAMLDLDDDVPPRPELPVVGSLYSAAASAPLPPAPSSSSSSSSSSATTASARARVMADPSAADPTVTRNVDPDTLKKTEKSACKTCAGCHKIKPKDAFSGRMWRRKPTSFCKACVADSQSTKNTVA